METLDFRPPYVVRVLAAPIGLLCLVAAFQQAWLAADQQQYSRIPVVALLLVPAGVAATILRRRIRLDDSAITGRTIVSTVRAPYSAVRRVDETRSGLVVNTSSGAITSAWLTCDDRKRLLKALVERVRLTRTLEEPPYGVLARYVPRAKEISFIPHHARKQADSADSGDVVS